MADRQLWVRIKADASGLVAGMSKASAAARNFDKELTKNAAKRQSLEKLGTVYRNVALAAGAGLALVVKSAMDWESAWAGVEKTVNGSTAELAALEGQLREMARTMPATHQEIAAVAEAAGQLGVATPDVAAFTRVMVQLGETTNLTADEAATSLAQFMNVMQTAPGDVDNLAAAVVQLGNNGASTERDIVQMAQNIAGAGKTVGLTETDVLALSNALASVGIEAEAGGSAVSRILIDMAKAAKTGSPALEKFAKASGTTAEGFKKMMDEDPAQAFVEFTKGLGKINKEGGDVFTLLKDLGQSDVRVTKALLGMANSGDLLTESLVLGQEAFKDNTALTDEYGKRMETAAAKAQVAWNGLKDNMIDIGADALPIIVEFSEAITDLTGAFSDLPKPVKGGMLEVVGMAAGFAAAMYGVTKMRTAFIDLKGAMSLTRTGAGLAGAGLLAFADDIGEVDAGLGQMTTVLGAAALGFAVGGPWGAAVGAGIGLLKSFRDEASNTRAEIAQLAPAFEAESGKMIEAAARVQVVKDLMSGPMIKGGNLTALEGAKAINIDLRTITEAAMGSGPALQEVHDRLSQINNLSPSQFRSYADSLGISVGDLADIEAGLGDVIDQNSGKWQAAGEAARLAAQALSAPITSAKQFRAALAEIPPAVVTELETLGYEASVTEIDRLTRTYNLTPAQVQTVLAALDQASPLADKVKNKMGALNGTTARPKINVSAGNSFSIINGIQRSINGMTGKTVYVKVAQRGGTPGGITKNADGNILNGLGQPTRFANGGFSENHVAQIAPAGAWRMWAEPETGGESYIPLAASKRRRSLEIWAETGSRLGVQGFADGGINGGASSSQTLSLVGAQVAIDPHTNIATFVRGEIQSGLSGSARHNARADRRKGRSN